MYSALCRRLRTVRAALPEATRPALANEQHAGLAGASVADIPPLSPAVNGTEPC